MAEADVNRPFRVLSLDGGGMRGIYTAAFLDRVCEQQAKRAGVDRLDLGLGFDLIVGTSTGAIVGCAAAVGCPMSKVVALYRNHGPKIFPHRIKGTISALYRAGRGRSFVRRGDAALRAALEHVLESTTLAQVYEKRGISMSIPTVLLSDHRSWVFKKTPVSGARDEDYSLVDICMATSAAPIYRSLAAVDVPGQNAGVKQVFADGGLWANNPVMVALTDALTIADHEQPIEIYSLGTCPRPEGEHITGDGIHRSLLGWRLGADVVPLAISAQEFAYDNMARLIAIELGKSGREVTTIRFPRKAVPASMMTYLALDDTRAEAMDRLTAQAHTDADLTMSARDDPRDPSGSRIKALLESLPALDPSRTLVSCEATTTTDEGGEQHV
ncbi:patatin-like phospholipase family protein [Pukyongiella litopenaei]|uniref:Patatin-like phospholipase family protein n=1 Tax=Pukyongiella litopenaei TaxID=2605946 RepID=A0A5C2H1N5_9RHOB|nr:patatin-like phospholipase family protein [Pukyongiella litopenaei]QEP30354.1 patatin-like phospholipase family protein [Pukyongiella litopenaei]